MRPAREHTFTTRGIYMSRRPSNALAAPPSHRGARQPVHIQALDRLLLSRESGSASALPSEAPVRPSVGLVPLLLKDLFEMQRVGPRLSILVEEGSAVS